MGNLYEEQTYRDSLDRINRLSSDSKALWGKMDAAQMLSHCSEVQDVINGKELKNTPFIVKLFKSFVKKAVTSDKPYPKNTGTHPQYVVESKMDFAKEKERLINSISEFHHCDRDKAKKIKHSLFGNMTLEEKGKASFKHLDHHLKQFDL